MVFDIGEYTIDDWSLGGLETSIGVRSNRQCNKRLNVVFDVGVARNCAMKCDALFVSHGHMDHCASLTNALGKKVVGSKSEQ